MRQTNPQELSILRAIANHIEDACLKLTDDYNPDKTFDEMGFDELDQVEIIMNIEVTANVHIDDLFAEKWITGSTRPSLFRKFLREERLNELLNE